MFPLVKSFAVAAFFYFYIKNLPLFLPVFFPLDYNRIQMRAVVRHQIILVYNSKLHAIWFGERPIDKVSCLGKTATNTVVCHYKSIFKLNCVILIER